tara:strand:+ start:249 stop:620 length:372 start_codon:yes stop_codon:yes gene_type:complete
MARGIEIVTIEEILIWRQWKQEEKEHCKFCIKGLYHKENRMDEWWQKKNDIDNKYRTILVSHNKERKKVEKEQEKLEKQMQECIEMAKKEKRRITNEKRKQNKLERKVKESNTPLRRSNRNKK